jgi:hypothetical protein
MARNTTSMALNGICTLVLAAILPGSAMAADSDVSSMEDVSSRFSQHPVAIEGVWDSTVTLTVCGAPVEIRKFRALNLFEHDGALVATSEAAPPPSLGNWRWLGGRKYRAQFRFQRFGAAGVFEGITEVTREITLAKGANAFNSVVSTRLFDAFDNPIGEGCGKEVAVRTF